MIFTRFGDLRGVLATSAAICAVAVASPAMAQTKSFDVPAQSAATGITELATQADVQILVSESAVQGKTIRAITGSMSVDQAVRRAAADAGLRIVSSDGRTYTLAPASSAPSSPETPSQSSGYRGNEIVVTAQKRVESVQDVPIAITALSSEDLQAQKIEGGPDIMRAVPNMTFTKTNFSSYNITIRGIGTKAISASSDPGVAVSFNNSGLIRNRLFEQEFFDLERVEVLRGPQGTLYGRNATGGVINLISAKPQLARFEGNIKAEVGNHNSRRIVGMLNVPIADDVLGVRVAGSMTQRDGYDYNLTTKNRINGRDLWSVRTSVGFEPAPWLRANFVWEHFNEDDNRSRTGKQLCHRDAGPEMGGSASTAPIPGQPSSVSRQAIFSQGCKPGSLYADEAFGTVNGLALPFVFFPVSLGADCGSFCANAFGLYVGDGGHRETFIQAQDPYGGRMQSRDLREIESIRDPAYRAKADIFQLNLELDLGESLTFVSQTAFNNDSVYSIQDYNRFNTDPVFTDTSQWTYTPATAFLIGDFSNLAPGGVFCDPQLGCSSRIAGLDLSSSDSKQFSQEVRLQSHLDGPLNFSVGANYTEFKTQDDYYVFNNVLTLLAMSRPFNKGAPGTGVDITRCPFSGYLGGLLGITPGNGPVPIDDPTSTCPYIDPNPIESINGEGHNYFRSSNPYKLESWAAFGEVYWNIDTDLKMTAGLRYTDDRKTVTPVPSQLLLAYGFQGAGTTSKGYPEKPDIKQHWGKFTGRFGLDWKPQTSFTDDTLIYAFYSRGYKAGGVNPPSPGYATTEDLIEQATSDPDPRAEIVLNSQIAQGRIPVVYLTANEYGETFEPEYVNSIEIGTKNVLAGGAVMLNLTGFYYDYKGYQVSQIRDRTSVNENFDATIWGLEFESQFAVTDRLRLNANVGYLKTRIADGETSIDVMNRTQGNPNYVVTKPWIQLPSNCVVPLTVAETFLLNHPQFLAGYYGMCGGFGNSSLGKEVIDPATGANYDVSDYPELNGGAGLLDDLGGNELPNSPHWTVNFGAEYSLPFSEDWSATLRGDAYWQGKSWARVYNLAPYDRLKSWTNFNLSLRVDGPDNLTIEAYVKNVFNSTPLTGAFLNGDDSGLTTNVFTLDPRIIGFSVAKKF